MVILVSPKLPLLTPRPFTKSNLLLLALPSLHNHTAKVWVPLQPNPTFHFPSEQQSPQLNIP